MHYMQYVHLYVKRTAINELFVVLHEGIHEAISSMCHVVAHVCVVFIYHYIQLSLHKPISLSSMLFFHGHSRYLCNFGSEDESEIMPHDMQALQNPQKRGISIRCCRRKSEGRRLYQSTSLFHATKSTCSKATRICKTLAGNSMT